MSVSLAVRATATRRRTRVLLIAVAIAVIASGVALSIGDYALSPDRLWQTLPGSGTRIEQFVVFQVRAPRTAMALATGAALGIAGALLLAMSRAIGETMIVTMAAGLAANLTFNPLDTVTTVTVQIVTLLTGDQEFNSAKTLSAFGLGLTLFLVTLMLNIVAHRIVQTYREQYD